MIYLLRHGEIENAGIRRFIGWTDVRLSPGGEARARQWNTEFRQLRFDAVMSSPLARAVRTAELVSGLPEEGIEPVPGLREINLGDWDGKSFEEIKARYPGDWQRRGEDLAGYRPPGGESFQDLSMRVLPVFRRILEDARARTILVVAHAGVNRVLLCSLLSVPLNNLFRIPQDYGALNRIERLPAGNAVRQVNALPENWKSEPEFSAH